MRKRLIIVIVLVLVVPLGLIISTAAAQDRDSLWREDLHYMAERLVDIHPNPYFNTSEEVFNQIVADLDASIPNLTDNQIMMEFARIAALFDGHTYLFLLQPEAGFRVYPFRMYQFEDGLYVIKAQETSLIGMRVTHIGNLTAEEAYAQMSPYSSADNLYTLREWVPMLLSSPEALHALGIIEDMNEPNYVLESANGDQVVYNPSMTAAPQHFGDHLQELAGLPQQPEPLYLSNKFENFWQTVLSDSGTLYIQYNHVYSSTQAGVSLSKFTSEIEDLLTEQQIERIIVDLRHNGGGDNTTYRPLINLLDEYEEVYVIIGRSTFSAASDFANDLDKASEHVLFVGEPVGSRPISYGQNSTITLPNSRLHIAVSTRRVNKGQGENDDRLWLAPDIPIPVTASDFFTGRDAALEAILDHAAA